MGHFLKETFVMERLKLRNFGFWFSYYYFYGQGLPVAEEDLDLGTHSNKLIRSHGRSKDADIGFFSFLSPRAMAAEDVIGLFHWR